MAYTKYYGQWTDAGYDSDGRLITPSATPFTAAAAEWWDAALLAATPQTTQGDLVGYTGAVAQRFPLGATGSVLVADPTQPAGLRWSLSSYVPASQRAPLGGVVTIGYAATITPDAAASTSGACTATGNVTVNAPTGGVAGELYLLRVVASGGARTVTMGGGVTLTTGTTRAFTVASGQTGLFGLHYAAGAWLLLSQTQTIAG